MARPKGVNEIIRQGMIHISENSSNEVRYYNYKELPDGDPVRVHIEKLIKNHNIMMEVDNEKPCD